MSLGARSIGALAAAMLLAAGGVAAEGITEQQADDILNELRAIRRVLERQQEPEQPQARPPADQKVSIEFAPGGYSLGRADAPVVMVEYADYQCPFCRQYHQTTFEQIKRNYVDTGRVRYVSRDFPLAFHEHARGAALAARCAGEQGRFWELRHAMIANANQVKAENIFAYAGDLGLDMDRFRGCLESGRYGEKVERDVAEGRAAGVSGTPSFVLGRLNGDRLEGIRIVGAMPYQAFASRLEEAIEQSR
ncbi:thioredoxin [Sulfurifustis variabilis]|uniref:Thioredoxin n=2 Tax=Sulfurifustis variabilis TaxID=1675686 RepID=A0A1B4V1V4_9GAMM|nr:thioredoxin [Sulfurifustis variabilis]